MTKEFFTGNWSKEDLITLAKYNNWETGANINTFEEDIEKLKKDIMENGNIGDTEARLTFSDENNLVYISIDSCIKVVNTICKYDFEKSSGVELF